MSGEYGGLYRGIVTGVDPSTLEKVWVSIPSITGKSSIWAFPCRPSADQSLNCKPGHGVWVMFENGELSSPVVMGFYGPVSPPDKGN
jgi:hypothetical protein